MCSFECLYKAVLQPFQGCGLPASRAGTLCQPSAALGSIDQLQAWRQRGLLPCACTLMPRVSALRASLDRAAAALFAALQAVPITPCITNERQGSAAGRATHIHHPAAIPPTADAALTAAGGSAASPLPPCLDPCLPTPRSEERVRCLLGSSDSRASLDGATAGDSETAAASIPDAGLQAAVRQLDACLPLAGECRQHL